RVGRIGVVVGELAVDLAVQLVHRAAQCPEQPGGRHAAHAVAAVDGDAHGAGQADVIGDLADVGVRQVGDDADARRRVQGRLDAVHGLAQGLDVVAVEGAPRHHHLETVVVGRVVAAGDGDARAAAVPVGGVVHQRGVRQAEVHRVDPARVQSRLVGVGQAAAAQPTVVADRHAAHAFAPGLGGQCQPEAVGEGFVDLPGHGAADVVGF